MRNLRLRVAPKRALLVIVTLPALLAACSGHGGAPRPGADGAAAAGGAAAGASGGGGASAGGAAGTIGDGGASAAGAGGTMGGGGSSAAGAGGTMGGGGSSAAGAGGTMGGGGSSAAGAGGTMGGGGSSAAGAGGAAGATGAAGFRLCGPGDGAGTNGGAGGVGAGTGGAEGTISFGWRALPSLAKKRQNAMGAAVNGTMYVIGGLDESGLLPDVERLAPGQTGWVAAPPLPNPQCCAAVAALDTVIAVAGGYGSDGHTPTNALLLFDSATGIWRSGPPMPTARANAMAANWNGKLAVIGGGTEYGAVQTTGAIEIYDPASETWTSSPLTVTPRAGGLAVADGDRIYVVGGAVQRSLYGDPIVEVAPADGVCRGPALGLGRVQVAGGLLPFGLVVAGGWTVQFDTPTVEGLLGARSAWQSLPPMPTSRAGAASAVVNGTLIVAGGGQYQGSWVYQDAVEVLEAR